MPDSFEFILIVGLVVMTAGLGLAFLWIADPFQAPINEAGKVDPILGAKDPVAIYDSEDPLIPMPDHLKTTDEMVAWMVGEMPKLTAELTKGRT